MKVTYKSLFLSIYIIYGIIFLSLATLATVYLDSSNVHNISVDNFKSKFNERDEFIKTYFEPSYDTLFALKENADFKEFVKNGNNKQIVQNLFATVKNSMGCLDNIRYIDTNGDEIIKVYGGPQHVYKEKTKILVAKDNQLQNVSHKYYNDNFLKLKENDIGYSKMDVSIDKIENTNIKKPTIRVAIAVFDEDIRKGYIIINLCLKEFFNSLSKTTLYNVYLVDNLGQFILYKENTNAIERLDNNPYTLYQYFNNLDAPLILSRDIYTKESYYSERISIKNSQDIKMILELKFDKLANKNKEDKINILLIMLIVMIFSLPIALYFAKKPDLLLQDIEKQLLTDKLTSLDNRSKLLRDLAYNKHNIIILINIDGFKEINNVFGYKSADNLLITLGKKLKEFINENQKYHLYKMASDEYAITYKFDNLQSLQILIHKLNDLIEKEPYYCGEECEVFISVTFGISDPYDIRASSDELRQADLALKRAKAEKKTFEIYSQDYVLLETYKENLYITKEIKLALLNDNVIVDFQPIYNNRTKQIEKYEALQRIKTTSGEILPPYKYLDIAKANKHYFLLTKRVIDKSFAYFSDKPYEFSINLGYADIIEDELIHYLKLKQKEHNLENRVVLEIIESEEIRNYKILETFLKEAKKCGFKIAIDDFGSGYSNFEQILKLSDYIDYIKIDGTLIKNIIQDNKSKIIVKTIESFCEELNIKTIAEFVSDESIYNFMIELDIDYSQGYYISKPTNDIVTKAEFETNI